MSNVGERQKISQSRYYELLLKEVGSKGVASRTLRANGPIYPHHIEKWASENGYACKVDGMTVTVAKQQSTPTE